ncbi:MAG: HAD hydrolase family protein [Cellvibrionaceae bacterium]
MNKPSSNTTENATERAKNIRLLLLDVDGILSDGRLYFGNSGEEIKAFNILDGMGIKLLKNSGVQVGIITGRSSQLLERRANNLGINLLVQGREDKFTALNELLESKPEGLDDITLNEIAFMGDDLPDLPVIRRVGLGLTVPNGHTEVQNNAHWQSERKGGEGAVREACDFILKAQGNYDTAIEAYL